MSQYQTIGFIGSGNMGEAFIGALIQSQLFTADRIFASDANIQRLEYIKNKYHINALQDNSKVFDCCDIIVFAVKPQQMNQVLSEISDRLTYKILNRKMVISIAAGFTISKIEQYLYSPLNPSLHGRLPIIRVMPNTPALVLEGISGMASNRYAQKDDIQAAKSILEAIGKVIEFREEDLDAVTALSGSGPAYVFFLVECMIEAGVQAGLSLTDASTLSLSTMKGALALMMKQNESPQELRRKVTSPGGTTEAAFKILDANHVKQHIVNAILAAAQRAKELSRL